MSTINPVIWFEIYVNDLNRAQLFYEQVLDVKLTDMPTPDTISDDMKMMAFPMEMSGEGAGGALVKMEEVKAGSNSTIVYFGSKDCAVEEGRIQAAGGKVLKSKHSISEYGFIVLAVDTEGNMFGIHSEA